MLITLLALIGATALSGLGKVDEGFNLLTKLTLGLIVATLIFAATGIQAAGDGLVTTITGRTFTVTVLLSLLFPLAKRFDAWDIQQWLWETWRFVLQIFPLLIIGVFLVGVIRVFIQPEWIQAMAGSNMLWRIWLAWFLVSLCTSQLWLRCRLLRCSCHLACTPAH